MKVLEFGGRTREPDVRWLYDMLEVLYDQEWLKGAKNRELYYMYRDLYLSISDRERLVNSDLRYDITVIPPGELGQEYVKTAGHYHPEVPGSKVTYPELYEVLEGEATYLLQSRDQKDVVLVRARAGDKVLIPPGYGHITVNASNKRLKMANFVARSFSSLYDPIRSRGGGAYFLTLDGPVANPGYPDIVPLREVDAPDNALLRGLGLSRKREMYALARNPEVLEYLTRPQDHPEAFAKVL